MKRRSRLLEDFGRVLSANGLAALTSAISLIVLPKLISTEQYALWQLFLFVTSYSLFLQFGLADGAYLRYGGMTRATLARRQVATQAVVLAVVLSAAAIVGSLTMLIAGLARERLIVFATALVYAVIVNAQHFFKLVLQATGEFAAFRRVVVLDRALFALLVGAALVLGFRSFIAVVAAEVLAKFASTAFAALIWIDSNVDSGTALKDRVAAEMRMNIKAGSQITVANTGNMLIVGIARLAVERVWGLLVFGSFSLSLNLVSFFMIFINAAGLAIFPTLKRASKATQERMLTALVPLLSTATSGILVFATPLYALLSAWLPDYSDGLRILLLLFPMVVFESRTGLLLTPLMKATRMETAILLANLPAVLVSLMLTTLFSTYFRSIELVAVAIVLALATRSFIAESMLRRSLGASLRPKVLFIEVALVAAYYACHALLSGCASTIAYLFVYLLYVILARKLISTQLKLVLGRLR